MLVCIVFKLLLGDAAVQCSVHKAVQCSAAWAMVGSVRSAVQYGELIRSVQCIVQ